MQPLVGQIMLFGGNFAPRGWAFCDGQMLRIEDNNALFAILGTTYGGDGRTTFALPDLRGRVPMHAGAGPDLTPRKIGQTAGSETVTLTASELPAHNHALLVAKAAADSAQPSGDALASADIYVSANPGNGETEPSVALSSKSIASSGGHAPHNNMQPSLCINYVIALQGSFPSRN